MIWAERSAIWPRPANLIRIIPAEGLHHHKLKPEYQNPSLKWRVFLHIVIFANGRLSEPFRVPAGDILIAADGGARYCIELGLTPSVVVGDMDSIDEATEQRLLSAGTDLIHHPARKDYTDLELALTYARDLGATEISIIAALGARWDQTLANLLLPASPEFKKTKIRIIDGWQEIQLIHGGEKQHITGSPGDTLSLIPIVGDAHGITTQGLEYPLHEGSLYIGSTRGISNIMLGKTADIHLTEGLLICVHIRNSESS